MTCFLYWWKCICFVSEMSLIYLWQTAMYSYINILYSDHVVLGLSVFALCRHCYLLARQTMITNVWTGTRIRLYWFFATQQKLLLLPFDPVGKSWKQLLNALHEQACKNYHKLPSGRCVGMIGLGPTGVSDPTTTFLFSCEGRTFSKDKEPKRFIDFADEEH